MEQLFGSIPAILNVLGPNEAAAEAIVFAAWKRTAGELLAERTAAVEFAEKRLVVAVEDNTWKRHLEELAPQMLAHLNGKLGQGSVTMIEFRIDTLAIASRKALEPKPPETAYVIPNSVVEAAGQIADESLREHFIEAAAAYLAVKK
jgi:hypothetical protein